MPFPLDPNAPRRRDEAKLADELDAIEDDRELGAWLETLRAIRELPEVSA